MLTRIFHPFNSARSARSALTHMRKKYRIALRGACVIGPDYNGKFYVHVPLGGTGFSNAEMASAFPREGS